MEITIAVRALFTVLIARLEEVGFREYHKRWNKSLSASEDCQCLGTMATCTITGAPPPRKNMVSFRSENSTFSVRNSLAPTWIEYPLMPRSGVTKHEAEL